MNCNYIIGIKMDNRVANAIRFQETLTKNGCASKTRLGMHETGEDACANYGIIVLRPCGTQEQVERLVTDLNAFAGVRAKLIDLI